MIVMLPSTEFEIDASLVVPVNRGEKPAMLQSAVKPILIEKLPAADALAPLALYRL